MKTFSELVDSLNEDLLSEAVPTHSAGKSHASSFTNVNVTDQTAFTAGPLNWNALITRSGKSFNARTKKDFVRNLISLIGQEESERYHDEFKNYVDLLWGKNKAGYSDLMIDVKQSFDKSNRPYTEHEYTNDDIERLLVSDDELDTYSYGADDTSGEHGQKEPEDPLKHEIARGKRKKPWSSYASFLKDMGWDEEYAVQENFVLDDFCSLDEAETLHWNELSSTERKDFAKYAKIDAKKILKKSWKQLSAVQKKKLATTISKTTGGEFALKEDSLTSSQEKKKEEIVLSMKKKKKEFQDRYGDDWESVMHATATKMAKEETLHEGLKVVDTLDMGSNLGDKYKLEVSSDGYMQIVKTHQNGKKLSSGGLLNVGKPNYIKKLWKLMQGNVGKATRTSHGIVVESVDEAIVRGDRIAGMPTGADRGSDEKPLMKWLTELERELKKIRSSYDDVDADVAIWLYQKGRNPKQTAKVLASRKESVEHLGEFWGGPQPSKPGAHASMAKLKAKNKEDAKLFFVRWNKKKKGHITNEPFKTLAQAKKRVDEIKKKGWRAFITKADKEVVGKWSDVLESINEKIIAPIIFDSGMGNYSNLKSFLKVMDKHKITTAQKGRGVYEVFPKDQKDVEFITKAASKYHMIDVKESVQIDETRLLGKNVIVQGKSGVATKYLGNEHGIEMYEVELEDGSVITSPSTEMESAELDESVKNFINKIKKILKMRDFDKSERKRKKEIKKIERNYSKNILGLESVEHSLDEAVPPPYVIPITPNNPTGIPLLDPGPPETRKEPSDITIALTKPIRVVSDHMSRIARGGWEALQDAGFDSPDQIMTLINDPSTPWWIIAWIMQLLGIEEGGDLPDWWPDPFGESVEHSLDEARMKDDILVVFDSIEKLSKKHNSTIDNIAKDTKLEKSFVQGAIDFWLDDKKIKKMGSGKKTHYMPESTNYNLSDFFESIEEETPATSTAGVAHTGDDSRVGIKKRKRRKKKDKLSPRKMLMMMDAQKIGESLEKSLRSLSTGDETPQFKDDYCGHPVFKVSEDEFSKCKTRRNKGERWNNFFEDDSPNYSPIRKYSHNNPNKPIVIQNELSGEMSIYRRRMNDQRLKHNKRAAK